MTRAPSWVAVLAISAFGAMACGHAQNEPSRVVIGNEITVSPAAVVFGVNERATLVARAVDTNGRPTGVRWTSASPRIASVSDSGIATGRAVGTTAVLARSLSDSTVSAQVHIEVR